MTVLLWGRADDPVVLAVNRACEAYDVLTLIVDVHNVADIDIDGDLVLTSGQRVTLDRVQGVFVRPSGQVGTPREATVYQALGAWAELTFAAVVNRPSAAASNRSKPYQTRIIAAAGLAVPDTLVTTCPDDVRAFSSRHGKVVYKSVSGVRSIVSIFDPRDGERLDDVTACPTQFQQYIDGVDHRVHVVGEELFACRVESDAIDYRYASASGRKTTLSPAVLPPDIAESCLSVTRSLGLHFAGIDLRCDPQGGWWCFEVNTAPGFIWFEHHTGHPIAAATARVLTAHRRNP
jgi:glutathione synthase/RimK-type ligase-like ATP-grasp enzyme